MTFDAITDSISKAIGHALALPVVAVAIIVSHLALGIDATNFGISVASMALLLVLQRTSNRDGVAIQAKLDEIVRAIPQAENRYIGLDRRSEKEIESERDA